MYVCMQVCKYVCRMCILFVQIFIYAAFAAGSHVEMMSSGRDVTKYDRDDLYVCDTSIWYFVTGVSELHALCALTPKWSLCATTSLRSRPPSPRSG